MRLAVIADVHANPDALAAVLADIRRRAIERAVHLGDLVGYHRRPRETLALIREHGIPGVHGNHDLMAIRRLPVDGCGPIARKAILWTQRALRPVDRAYLERLPAQLRLERRIICLHSTLGNSVARLTTPDRFREAFIEIQRFDPTLEICFTGHTHVPGAVEVGRHGVVCHRGSEVHLTPGAFWFVNPGSVGQPRDGDDRASYAVLDCSTGRVAFPRLAYIPRHPSRVRALVSGWFAATVGGDA